MKLLRIIEEGFTAIMWIASIAFVLSLNPEPAKADYMSVSVGDSRYKKNDVWEQVSTGYESDRKFKSNTYMLAYLFERKNYDVRIAYKDYGDFHLGALWGDPDNPSCHTCSATTSSVQSGYARSIGIAWQPKYTFAPEKNIHLTFGAEYYSASWSAHFFHATDANQNSMVYSGTADIHTSKITASIGAGFRWRGIVGEYEYAPIGTEGKGQKWGGAGAFNGASMFTIGIVHEFK